MLRRVILTSSLAVFLIWALAPLQGCDRRPPGTVMDPSVAADGGQDAQAPVEVDGAQDAQAPLCGNGVVDPGEECDGQNFAGRTCNELGFPGGTLACADDCEIDTSGCTQMGCGNGNLEPGEQCDDGNTDACDGCSVSCQVEPQPTCGNGTLECGEQCDDGNSQNCDGCSSSCQNEPAPTCGNGVIECGEPCDDGNTQDCDGCSGICEVETCGNGVVDCAEQCDDGVNGDDCDGCLDDCKTYISVCGDGIVCGTEECDDGNQTSGDGCNTGCKLGYCGNGMLDPGEQCDATDFGAQTCLTAVGHQDGELQCLAQCLLDVSGCHTCGDSICELANGETLANCPLDCGLAVISAGDVHTCALKRDGSAWCWGHNDYGQLGDSTTTDTATPVQVSGLSGAVSISAGDEYTCATRSDGTAWCWGVNGHGQLGDGATHQVCSVSTDCSPVPVQPFGLTPVLGIAASINHTCAVMSDGTAWCWGCNTYGKLGNGGGVDTVVPVQVSGLADAVSISVGHYSAGGQGHSCALHSDGTARCWGANYHRQLGDGTYFDSNVPVTVLGLTGALGISAGYSYTCSVHSDRTAWCWGWNSGGQLGDGTTTDASAPVQVSGLSNVVSISAGMIHTCAAKGDGTAWCWGWNSSGKLGNGTDINSNVPVQVSGLSGVVSISAGDRHSCAVLSDGTAWCWGRGAEGQLGNGTEISSSYVPLQVIGL